MDLATILNALDSAPFAELTLFRTAQGYQASTSDNGKSWHVMIAATPSAALAECLGVSDPTPPLATSPVTLAPPPY